MNIKDAKEKIEKQIQTWNSAEYNHERGFANGQVAGLTFAKKTLDEISVPTDTNARCIRVLKEKLEQLQDDRQSMWDARLDCYVATIDAKIETVKELLAEIS